jgi:hypothetical protein
MIRYLLPALALVSAGCQAPRYSITMDVPVANPKTATVTVIISR